MPGLSQLTSPGATALVDLVVAAGLVDTLAGEGPFTVFAPTNDAFAKVGWSFVMREGQLVFAASS